MIKLNTLTLDNFMCVEHAELDFTNQKVIILLGENGHGKSTVLDAISLCLNETKRGDSFKDYVKRGTDKAHIVLDCELKGVPALFDVYINAKGATMERKLIYNNNADKPYVNSEVSKVLEKLEMSYYADIIMSMQGEDDITKLSPAQRADYLQKLLNFSFDEQVQFCKNYLETVKANSKHDEEVINLTTANINTRQSQLVRVPVDDFSDRIAELTSAKETIISNLSQYQGLHDQQSTITTKLNTILQDKYNTKAVIDATDTSLAELPNLNALLDKYEKDLETLNGSISSKLLESEQLNKSLTELNSRQASLDEERSNIINTLATKRADLNIVLKHISLIDSGKCPECGHEFTQTDKDAYIKQNDELNKVIEDLTSQRDSIQTELDSVKADQSKISASVNSCAREVNSMNTNINSINFDKEKIIEKVKYLENDAQVILSDKKSHYEDLLKEEERLNKEQAQLSASLKEYELLNSDLQNAQVQLNNLNQKALMRENVIKSNEQIKAEVANLQEAVSKAQTDLEQLHREESVYKEAQVLLSKNLPDYLIIKACAALEREMNNFIHIVFPEMEVRLFQNKKGIEFFYTTDVTDDYSKEKLSNVKMASGFEKSVLSIAFKVALCKAYNLPFAFFDEVDGQGTDDNASKLFRSLLTNGLFDQVFVISHKASVRDTIKSTADDVRVYYVNHGNFSLEGDY